MRGVRDIDTNTLWCLLEPFDRKGPLILEVPLAS